MTRVMCAFAFGIVNARVRDMHDKRQFYIWSAVLIAALTLTTIPIFSQAISGDLVGTVTDPTGAAVPNATVTATNTGTGVKTSGVTNAGGQYRLSNLPPGTYDLSAAATGFSTATLKNVPVELNKVATANITLQVGQVSESVNVTEAPPLIDTTTAQIQNTFNTKATEDLPSASIGAGVLNLSLLNAGVATSGGAGVGYGPSVGGQRPRNNNFTVEGVDNNRKDITGPQAFVPNDAVQEFTVLQNQFSPEYGHSSGGQFNTIVRSGTNEFHGMFYEYLRNRNLNAIDQAFHLTSNPRYDQNRLGAQGGGAIKKNKWFYFANFEYNPLGQAGSAGTTLAPTAQGYSILSSIPGLSQTNLNVLKQYVPAAATASDNIKVNNVTVPVGILTFAAPNYQNGYYGVLSSDYTFSERDQLRGRFIYNRVSFIDTNGVTLPQFFVLNPSTFYVGSLAEYHTFSPNVTNELRLGYNRANLLFGAGNFKYPGLDAFPNLTFEDLQLQIGPDPNAPQGGIQNTYQVSDNVTWIKGAHTIKFGAEFRRYIAPQVFTQRARGDYDYSTLDLFLRDITPDFLAQRGLGNVVYYGDQIANYDYVQDTWRMRPNFTVNLGLRYEYTTVPVTMRTQKLNAIASVPGVIDFSEPRAQKTAFAPRIGFAYSPGNSQNTSIRAGFGMAYDVLFDNIGLLALPPELSSTADVTGAGEPNFLKAGGIPPDLPGGGQPTPAQARAATAGYIPLLQKLPYSIQWNVGVQHVFAKDYTLDVRYVGTRGIHLPMQQQIDIQPRVTADRNIPTFLSAPNAATLQGLPLTVGDLRTGANAAGNILPAFRTAGFRRQMTTWTPQGISFYNGLSVQLDRRFSNGLQFRGAYTWSHLLDNSTTEFGATWLTPRRAQDFQNLRPEWASSLLDRRHRFTFTMLYDVPWFKNGSWFMKNLVGNWEIAPVYTYESPEFFTVQSAIDSNLNGDSAGDRTIVNPNGTPHTGSDVYGLDRQGNRIGISDSAAKLNTVVAWVAVNPNARYIRAGYGAVATGSRNTEASRPINDVDLTLMKRFNFTERMRFQLGAQALNLFNHPQFIPGSINDVQPILSAFNPGVHSYVTASHPLFNNPEAVFSSNPRVVQIVAKFLW